MYISVRDCQPLAVFGSIKAGLDAMGINSVELEYFRDRTVFSVGVSGAREPLADGKSMEVFRRKCSELDVRVSALLLHNNFATKDLDVEIDWVISCIKAADKLGVKAVRIDAFMSTEEDWPLDQRIQRFADCMGRVLDSTSDSDVQMGIENHGVQGNTPEFLDTVLNKVGSSRLGITVDTANFYWAGYPLSRVKEIIEHFAPRTKHTHVKNINFPEDQREIERPVGWEYGAYASTLRQGDIDIKWLVDTLRGAGYDGDLCIEDESVHRWDVDGQKEALIDDARVLRELI